MNTWKDCIIHKVMKWKGVFGMGGVISALGLSPVPWSQDNYRRPGHCGAWESRMRVKNLEEK